MEQMPTDPDTHCGVFMKPRFAMGSSCTQHKSLSVQSPCTVVSCVGKIVRFWDIVSATSAFIHMSQADVIQCMAVNVSTSGKYAAVLQTSKSTDDASESADASSSSQVAIFNIKLQKLVRIIRPQLCQSGRSTNHVLDFGMSGGLNKLLYVIWGPDDPTLTVYRWYTGKAIACARDYGVIRAVFEPVTDLILAISEHAVMTFSLYQDSIQKATVHEMTDNHARYTCAAFCMGYCIVGDSLGLVTVFQSGDLLGQVDAAGTTDTKRLKDCSRLQEEGIHQLVDVFACGRGFATATQGGVVSMFTTGEQNRSAAGPFQLKAQHAVTFSRAAKIRSLAASATGEYVVVMSTLGDQYVLHVADAEESSRVDAVVGENPLEDKALAPFTLIQKGAHAGRIVAMHAQDKGSLLVTAGADHTVRVYDAFTAECIVVHTVMDDITAVALHPMAPLLLVGMHSSLCLFEVLLNRLVHSHEFGYPKTAPIAVSSAGHQFAAVSGGSFSIIISETLSGEVVARLSGHASTVTGLSWTHDDLVLCSTSMDGAVMVWNCQTRQRLQEFDYTNKTQQFQSVFAMPKLGCVTVCAHSGLICCVENGELVRQEPGPCGSGGSCLLGFGRVLLVGDAAGTIHSWPWYSTEGSITPAKISAHNSPLLHLCACAGQSMLVSAAADGSVIVWDLQVILAGLELPPQWRPPVQISYKVARTAIKHLQQKIRELGQTVLGAEAAARAKAAIQVKELQDTIQTLESEVSTLGQQLDEQEERFEKQREILTEHFQAKRRALEALHMQATVQLETTYETRLELERATLKAELAERDDIHFNLEETLQRMRKAHRDEVMNLQKSMAAQIDNLQLQCQIMQKEGITAQDEYSQVIQQTEAEFDDNTERMKVKLQQVEGDSRDTIEELKAHIHVYTRDNLRLKGEKLQDTRTMTKQRNQIQDLEIRLKSQTHRSHELQIALQDHQCMSVDDHAVMDKLQDKVSHLQTVGFVMGERAKQFSEEVQPRRDEVAKLTEQRSRQDQELARTLHMVESLKHTLSQKHGELRSVKEDATEARQKAATRHALLGQMKADLASVMHEPDDTPAGRGSSRLAALADMARKWINTSVTRPQEDTAGGDSTMRRQLLAAELKSGLADFRASRLHRSSKAQKAQQVTENVQLLQENNGLRRENQHLRQELQRARGHRSGPANDPPLQQAELSMQPPTESLMDGMTATGTTEDGAYIQEDDGGNERLDLAFVSFGSRAQPSRMTASAMLQPPAHNRSLNSHQQQSAHDVRDLSAARTRRRPKTAIGLGSDGRLVVGLPQRPVSAQPHHSGRTVSAQRAQIRLGSRWPQSSDVHSRALSSSVARGVHDKKLGRLLQSQIHVVEDQNSELRSHRSTFSGHLARYQQGSPHRRTCDHTALLSQLHSDPEHGSVSKMHIGDAFGGARLRKRRPTSASGVGVHDVRARLTGKPLCKHSI